MKELKDISWQVDEETYRKDSALSYSTLARYEREGFNNIDKLFDKIETPSTIFGGAVDAIITGGMDEFNSRFVHVTFPKVSDTIISIVKELFNGFKDLFGTIEEIPEQEILGVCMRQNYGNRFKDATKLNNVITGGSTYYKLLHKSNGKIILDDVMYQDVMNTVRILKESEATSKYFAEDNPFENIKKYYQLKFKSTFGGINYRCMCDLLIVDYDNKIIQPIDLKTSSKYEWDFYKSFIDWMYMIQARLYYRIIEDNCKRDGYFKDFKVLPFKFIVANKTSLTPLVWDYNDTRGYGVLTYGGNNQYQFRDPEEIGKELYYYLSNNIKVPNGIKLNEGNSIEEWLNKL